jgi:hypothetical protein
MNIVSPLTLLLVPLIGSILIISYPNNNSKNKKSYYKEEDSILSSLNAYLNIKTENPRTERLLPLKEIIEMPLIEKNNSDLKKIAIIISLINFVLSIFLWIQFDSNYIGSQFVTNISSLEFIQFKLGIDGISIFFVLLTTFITPIALLSSHNDIEKNLKLYLVSILLLETLQIGVFVVLDLLLFYIFFESVLIPLFLIVGIWGASSAKVRAAFLLFLYTLKNQCKRAKFRGSPKALITKLFKETY